MSIFPEYCIVAGNGKLYLLNLENQGMTLMRDNDQSNSSLYYSKDQMVYSDDRKQIAFVDGKVENEIIIIDVSKDPSDLKISRVMKISDVNVAIDRIVSFQGDSFVFKFFGRENGCLFKVVKDCFVCTGINEILTKDLVLEKLVETFGRTCVKVILKYNSKKYLAKKAVGKLLTVHHFDENGNEEFVDEFTFPYIFPFEDFYSLKNGKSLVFDRGSLHYYDSNLNVSKLKLYDFTKLLPLDMFSRDVSAGRDAIYKNLPNYVTHDLCTIITNYVCIIE